MDSKKGKKIRQNLIIGAAVLAGIYAVMSVMAKRTGAKKNNVCEKTVTYISTVKPIIDRVLSFLGLILLSPLYFLISVLIYVDDPGPVLFTQKRVGKDKRFFQLHKFRSMKMTTPHDVPTHQLKNPEQYITRVGKILRKYSLDELPQIWDIFAGNMSIIGPRPALWNQDDLVAEREKYGANDVLPGLTGWAQINGRDELEIAEKAKFDGEYVEKLRQGGMKALFFDVKCFLGTFLSVARSEGVVEGGTGTIYNNNNSENLKNNHKIAVIEKSMPEHNTDYEKDMDFTTNPLYPKKILITGKDSYIGEAVREYLKKSNPDFYHITILDTVGVEPQKAMFEGYDVVFNVAGIAHVHETDANSHLYYEVNRDLVIKLAKTAKEAGVKQFILLSSMSVYGITTGQIEKDTVPYPTTAYGESKLAADEMIETFADENFHVAILRPPMVYGKGCRGNYQLLRKAALKSPVFPEFPNRRSMLFIGNLCEFIKRIIDRESSGIFFPQNKEYVRTSEMVKLIAKENGKLIVTTSIFNFLIRRMHFNILQKVFGNLTYSSMDKVEQFSFEESIHLTEEG